ncbi:MAG: YidC/Oxa1 family membrane protein insertase [Clostridia bacterium]|nr:YidC/Oxa1 family membrane protein insertase [Clostridia bacterium]
MFFISAFLKDVLEFLHTFIGNYGWSIVVFTLLIRLVLLPLDIKSKKSMKRMTDLQPKLAVLQKKYANDKDKLNQKMSELYRKEHVNPMSGCFPMLLSLPILFCMFDAMRVLANEYIVQMILDMKDGVFNPDAMQSWLWIKNVFMPDSFMSTIVPAVGDQLQSISVVDGTLLTQENLDMVREFLTTDAYREIAASFGADGSYIYQAPVLMWTIAIPSQFNGYFLLPLLAGVSQFLSASLLTPQTAAVSDQQKSTNSMMKWFFPIFSVWICATSNSAFSLYWVAVNLIQMIQQYVLNKVLDKKPTALPEEVSKP